MTHVFLGKSYYFFHLDIAHAGKNNFTGVEVFFDKALN